MGNCFSDPSSPDSKPGSKSKTKSKTQGQGQGQRLGSGPVPAPGSTLAQATGDQGRIHSQSTAAAAPPRILGGGAGGGEDGAARERALRAAEERAKAVSLLFILHLDPSRGTSRQSRLIDNLLPKAARVLV